MAYSEKLRDMLVNPDIGKQEKILLILLEEEQKPKAVSEIIEIATSNGFRDKSLRNNPSRLLSSYSPKAVRTQNGWEITTHGINYLKEKGFIKISPAGKQQSILRDCLARLQQEDVKNFLEEAVTALEHGLLRSSIVLSWIGALSILQEHVLKSHLKDFNQEMAKRLPKIKQIKSKDDFSVIKEFDFLQICCSISVFGKSVKQELEQCLRRRNDCGHPNQLTVGEHMVASHLEFLIKNIFDKFV